MDNEAWAKLEEMRAAGCWVLVASDPADNGQWFCSVQKEGADELYELADTAAEAVGRVYAQWKAQGVNDEPKTT